MSKTRQRPTREEGGRYDRYRETHPAYGMIGAANVSSMTASSDGHRGAHLFGSDFDHNHFITIRVHTADLSRGHETDWYHADRLILELSMSEQQWARFVAAPNRGDGVPCTLEWVHAPEGYDGQVPAIAPFPDADRRVQFNDEVKERYDTIVKELRGLAEKAPTQKMRREIELVEQHILDGLPWVVKRFDEHAEETIEKAKVEVAAYVQQAISRAGLKALGIDEGVPLSLTSGEPEPDGA